MSAFWSESALKSSTVKITTSTTGDNHGCFCRSWDPVCDPSDPCLAREEEARPVGGGGDVCRDHLDEVDAAADDDLSPSRPE